MGNGIDLGEFGFKSRAAFLRANGISRETFENMIKSDWQAQKAALLHRECPLDLRELMTKDPIWYKRLVAYFATKGPNGYYMKAKNDPDKRVRNAYIATVKAENRTIGGLN